MNLGQHLVNIDFLPWDKKVTAQRGGIWVLYLKFKFMNFSTKKTTYYSNSLNVPSVKGKQEVILFHNNKIHTYVPIPYTPLLENRSQYEFDAARRFLFYIAPRIRVKGRITNALPSTLFYALT
jgi:hypothetical protein